MPTTYGNGNVPQDVAEVIARYHFGEQASVRHDASRTVHDVDGGSYTLVGTRIGAEGESGIVYRAEAPDTYHVEFYDHSASTWVDNGDGTLTKHDLYGGPDETVRK